MSAHTSGPWHVEVEGVVTDCEYGLIADCSCRNHITVKSRLTSQANARLIAAAPDLLDAAIEASDIMPDPNMDCDCMEDQVRVNRCVTALRAAIAKAKGETL